MFNAAAEVGSFLSIHQMNEQQQKMICNSEGGAINVFVFYCFFLPTTAAFIEFFKWMLLIYVIVGLILVF